ncbi:hypothetical protein GW17_00051404 [Ensete ventricosum]|nr:hypothetical protein GW17_00051404 [Ensete ventricosum]
MPLTQQKKDFHITNLEAYTMASEEAINAKFEAFESRMEEKMRSLFAEFSIGRPSSPRKSQHKETLDQRRDPQKYGHITFDLNNLCMKVNFPRWEEGNPIGWISCTERYFRFYRTANNTRVEIAAIHLEGDAIQWFNWFKHTHRGLSWQRFKEGLLNRFGPTVSTTSTDNWQRFVKPLQYKNIKQGLKSEIRGEVKAREPYTLMTTISFARIQEERLNYKAQRNRETNFLRLEFHAGGAGDEGGHDLFQETFFCSGVYQGEVSSLHGLPHG